MGDAKKEKNLPSPSIQRNTSLPSRREQDRLSYREYLKSDHWKKLRARKKKKSCAICGLWGPTDRHHLNYRHLFDVQKTDLRNLCRTCHDVAHQLLKSGVIIYKNDSHHSRFTRTTNAVKKHRFGNPGISKREIAKRMGWPDRPKALRAKSREEKIALAQKYIKTWGSGYLRKLGCPDCIWEFVRE